MIPSASDAILFGLYLLPAFLAWFIYTRKATAKERIARQLLEESTQAKMLEPPSLHPDIDPNLCLGCGTCVEACPETGVLGMIDRKAVLVSPANCIGHGACKTACPTDAISLVFGTERRGIDIPFVSESFETNVPGAYIAGELGGMGLIRNAVTQGRQAVENIAAKRSSASGSELDLLIVGAGPGGFSASLAAKDLGLKCITIEQETLGGTVAHYPRGKIVMTAPMLLPIYGKVKMRETTKEALLELWEDVEKKTGVQIQYGEQLKEVERTPAGFKVKTTTSEYSAKALLLCIGRRGTPRKLNVPGEDSPKVVYRLADPDQYADKHVLVVGGGDSALEAAVMIGEEVAGSTVTLSYRSASFGRAKPKNRKKIEEAVKNGVVRLVLESQVVRVEPESVLLKCKTGEMEIENHGIIVCAGGILPTPMLEAIGIEVETKYGSA